MVRETNKTVFGLVTLSLMFLWVYKDFIPNNVLIVWTILQVIFIGLRYINSVKLDKYLKEHNQERIQVNVRFFFIIIIYSTFVWNFAFLATFLYAPSYYEFMTLSFIMGILTAGIVSISPMYRIFVIYFILMLAPMMLVMLYFGESRHYSALLFLMIYIPVILTLAKSLHDKIISESNINDLLQLKIDELKIISTTDALTNVYNRRYFFESGGSLIRLSHRENVPVSFLMIDLDHFKVVNDTYGHQIGDDILVDFSYHIEKMSRNSDIFARIGGEEFALLVYKTSDKDARKIAQNICNEIEKKVFQYDEVRVDITVSIGLSSLSTDVDTLDKLYKEADENLYEAKKSGRNRVV